MPRYEGTHSDANPYFGTVRRASDRAPVTFAEDVQAGEALPGGATTDNDAESWRKHLKDGVSSAQEGVAHALARLAAFGDAIDPNGFSAVTSAQAAAGYAFAVVENAPAADGYLAGNDEQTIATSPSGSLSVAVRTPRGVDARAVVIDHRRGENLVATYPRSSDDWDFLTQPDGSPHYSYWKLVDSSVGSTIGISGVQVGDTFDMRVHDATAFDDFIVDQLPDVAGRKAGNIVVLRNHDGDRPPGLYELKVAPDDYFEGLIGDNPIAHQDYIRTDHNPDSALLYFGWTQSGHNNPDGFSAGIRRSVLSGNPPANLYVEATHYSADGSAIENNNAIAGSATTRFTLTRDAIDDNVFADAYAYNGIVTSAVIALWRGFDQGGRLRIKVYTDSAYTNDLVTLGTNQWDRLTFSEDEGLQLQAGLNVLSEAIARATLDQRITDQIRDLQDRTRYIEFTPDTEPVWALIDGNDDGSKGGVAFIGDLVMNADHTFFDGIQYDGSRRIASDAVGFTRSVTSVRDLEYNSVVILWVLPNDAVWDHLRVRGLRSNGTEAFKIRAQDLRNVPDSAKSELNLRNIPADYTVRWTAHPNNEVYGLGDAGPGATFVMEQLPGEGHIPIWTGELRDRATDRIDHLDTLTRDIQSAESSGPTWEDASSDTEGGLWASDLDNVSQQQLTAAAWAVSVANLNITTSNLRARIPTASDPSEARVSFHDGHDGAYLLSQLAFLGVISGWRYYEYTGTLRHADAKLQIDAAHASGTTTWGGRLKPNSVTLDSIPRAVRDSLADHHRFPAWLDEVANLNTGETFNNRGWLIPNANRWNVNGSVSIEDNGGAMDWLRIDAAAVLGPQGRGAQGIRVILERGTPSVIIGSLFIPWSTFRSIDGNYVHNADRGHAQGVAAGMWDPSQRNSMIFADCRYTDGRFLITFTSANAGQSATSMTIYTAG